MTKCHSASAHPSLLQRLPLPYSLYTALRLRAVLLLIRWPTCIKGANQNLPFQQLLRSGSVTSAKFLKPSLSPDSVRLLSLDAPPALSHCPYLTSSHQQIAWNWHRNKEMSATAGTDSKKKITRGGYDTLRKGISAVLGQCSSNFFFFPEKKKRNRILRTEWNYHYFLKASFADKAWMKDTGTHSLHHVTVWWNSVNHSGSLFLTWKWANLYKK